MKTEDLLILDLRKEENKEIIQKALRKIKPFANCEEDEVPLQRLEKFVAVMTKKYNFEVQWIMFVVLKNNTPFWRISLREGYPKYEWLGSVEAKDLYELMCKTCILIYSIIKSGRVGKREEKEKE